MAFIKSKKVYAILINSEDGKSIVEKAPDMSEEELESAIDDFFGKTGQANPDKEDKGVGKGKKVEAGKQDNKE